MTQRPHPEALLDAAVRYANHGIPILPDQLVNRRPDPAAGPPVCACRRRDCPALPIHGPSRLDDGQSVTWLRPLDPTTALPDGAETFWALVELPANQKLADPNLYTFPT